MNCTKGAETIADGPGGPFGGNLAGPAGTDGPPAADRALTVRSQGPARNRTEDDLYGILIYPGVEPIDIGAAYGVLSMAKRVAPDLAYVGIAREAGEVVCANGLRVWADHGFADAPAITDLIVTGGPGWTAAASDHATLAYLKKSRARITSICTGAMILDAAGLLDGRQATTKYQVFDGEKPPAELLTGAAGVDTAVLVDDDGIVTGGGVTLGIDTMFYCLARSHGAEVARETARVMEYDRALAANRQALGYRLPDTAMT